MPVSIPIFFKDRSGRAPVSLYQGAPLVSVVFRFDPDAGTGQRTVSNYQSIDALIDTGADFNVADPKLIAANGNILHKSDGTYEGVGSGPTRADVYIGHLFFPTIGKQIETDFLCAPVRSEGRPFDLILGTLFLQVGVLHMDYVNRDFHFEFS